MDTLYYDDSLDVLHRYARPYGLELVRPYQSEC